MSIATSGVGNNPATESRAAYDYAAVRSVHEPVTDTAAKAVKTDEKKTPSPVRTYSPKKLRYNMDEQRRSTGNENSRKKCNRQFY